MASNMEKNKKNDDVIPYYKIKDLWKREFENERLQKLKQEDLLTLKLIKKFEKKNANKNTKNKIMDKTLTMLKFYVYDLAKLRVQKILFSALNEKKIEEDASPIENQLLNLMKETIKNYIEKFQSGELGYIDIDSLKDIEVAIPDKKTKREIIVSKINIGDIVGIDGLIYTNIEKNNICNLPKENADVLSEKGLIDTIELGDE